jgi:hypothetical protein
MSNKKPKSKKVSEKQEENEEESHELIIPENDISIHEVSKIKFDGDDESKGLRHGMSGVPAAGKAKYRLDENDMLELMLIKTDIFYWLENYYYITFIHPSKKSKKIQNGIEVEIPIKVTEPIALYNFQREIIRKFMNKQHMVTVTSRQLGKDLALNTPIPTPNGWTTMGELKQGDVIFDEKGNPTTVLITHPIKYDAETYKITFSTGETIIANADHNWWTQSKKEKRKKILGSMKTTKQIIDSKDEHRIYFQPDNEEFIKQYNYKVNKRNKYIYITNIEPTDSVPMRCITVDSPNSLYLCGKTMIPTHNTTILVALAIYQACFNEKNTVLVYSHMESSAKMIVGRIKEAYRLMPNHLKPAVKTWGALEIEFENGSVIKAGPTSIKSGHGETIDLLLLDEFDYVQAEVQEGFILGIMPTISTSRGKIFICSSANSTRGYFYKYFQQAQKGDSEWNWHMAYWYDVPGRGEEFKQKAISECAGDMRIFRKAYECDFGATEDVGVGLMAEHGFNVLNKKRKSEALKGYEFFGEACKFYEHPNQDNIYIMGVDPAEGIGGDNSVIQVFDFTDLSDIKQVAEYAYNKIHPLEFSNVILKMAKIFGSPWIAIERDKSGAMIIENLIREHKYPKLVHWGMKNDKKNYYQRYGINCQGNSKKVAITHMRYYLDTVHAVTINSPDCLDELIHFKRLPNGTWQGVEKNDDRITSMIWAFSTLHEEVINQCFEVLDKDINGKPLKVRDKIKINSWQKIESGSFFRPIPSIKSNNNIFSIHSEDKRLNYGNFSGWKLEK